MKHDYVWLRRINSLIMIFINKYLKNTNDKYQSLFSRSLTIRNCDRSAVVVLQAVKFYAYACRKTMLTAGCYVDFAVIL